MQPFFLNACRLGLLSLLLAAALAARAAPPAIDSFFDNPALSAALLSPDARSLAVRVGSGTVRERLAVVDLATNSIKVIAQFSDLDRRVPLYHGEKFYSAVKRTNPHVEWVVYNEEGHGWALPKNRIDFWSRVEKFLARHIGTPGQKAD